MTKSSVYFQRSMKYNTLSNTIQFSPSAPLRSAKYFRRTPLPQCTMGLICRQNVDTVISQFDLADLPQLFKTWNPPSVFCVGI